MVNAFILVILVCSVFVGLFYISYEEGKTKGYNQCVNESYIGSTYSLNETLFRHPQDYCFEECSSIIKGTNFMLDNNWNKTQIADARIKIELAQMAYDNCAERCIK